MTGRQQNSLRLFCFLPVNPSFVAAFAALKVSLWRRMSADATGSLILTKRQHPRCAERLLECFLFVLLFRFQGTFSRGENEFIIKSEIYCLEEKRIYHGVEKALTRRKAIYHGAEKALLRRKDGFATERIAWCVVLKPFKQSYVAAAHQKSV